MMAEMIGPLTDGELDAGDLVRAQPATLEGE
jgi:hypothetical protein